MRILKRLGCGVIMLGVISAMYSVTESVIGSAVFAATIGVRQGSPTSCILFLLYVNDLIRLIKDNCRDDGFLKWLHVLILMDDTVLLSTSRERMMNKLFLMKQFCNEYGMRMNESKTKFFVIHGTPEDNEAVHVDGLVIERCTQYIYLGSAFTADGSVSSSVRAHADAKMSHVMKFISFLRKNNDIPFQVKKRVFDACLMSSILYGCESWLDADLRPVRKLYNWSLKNLLDVRLSTCNDVCYVEAGYPPLHSLVKNRQRNFFSKMWLERQGMEDDPLTLAIKSSMEHRYQTRSYIEGLLHISTSDIDEGVSEMKENIYNSTSSKRLVYKEINPTLSVHSVYKTEIHINEYHRVAFTRFRVSAHSLAVEVGRWNRRGLGRLPLEERLCVCGQIQTEAHVVEHCTLTQHLRYTHSFSNIPDLFSDRYSDTERCFILYKILDVYKT